MSPKVQIVLMSYNRPEYIVEAIDSILKQNYSNVDFLISDNSTNSQVETLVKQAYPQVNYIKRTPSMSMSAHWNMIISEVTADYFMMFHDDDYMNNDCVSILVETLENNKNAVGCSGNAKIIRDKTLTTELHNKNLKNDLVFNSVYEFGQRYFNSENGGVNPFPGYMYRTTLVKQLRFNNKEAGKHSDVTFLFKSLGLGSIVWTSKITMNYRLHNSNDSVGVDILSLSNLVKFYLKIGKISKPDTYSQEFIIKNYIFWVKQVGFNKLRIEHPLRFKIIVLSIIKYFIFSPARFLKLAFRQLGKQ